MDNWVFCDGKLTEKGDDIDTHKCDSVKDVFKTFKEINQLELVRQSGVRQQYIDQSVSLNLNSLHSLLQSG